MQPQRVTMQPVLVGCDFTSSPTRAKPIVLAFGAVVGGRVQLARLEKLPSLQAFGDWLKTPGDWLGVFDFPFGLPRELVERLSWPTDWPGCIRHYASLSRADIRATFAAFCAARPVGGKFAHRAADIPAKSHPSMKWVNPPVAYMLHAAMPLLLDSGAWLPGLHAGNVADVDAHGQRRRVALEGYPGLLAREILRGRSYKSDDKAKQTPERLIARKDLVTALEHGQTRLRQRLKLSHAQRDLLVDDATGDSLDAVLCLVQAAWAAQQGAPRYGLPEKVDPLEGWIVTA
jgi:hypothetical protein